MHHQLVANHPEDGMRGAERLSAASHVLRGLPVKYRYSEFGVGMKRLAALIGPHPNVIDVGANFGGWTRALLEASPNARVLMIEAQREHETHLKDLCSAHRRLEYEIAVLDETRGRAATLHLVGEGPKTGTSLRTELSRVPSEPRHVVTETLDHLIAQRAIAKPIDCVKLDTQGTELQILRGARQVLSDVRYLVLEASLVPYNEGAPFLEDAVAWCRSSGFVVRDILDRKYRGNHLLQCDIVFGRDRASV